MIRIAGGRKSLFELCIAHFLVVLYFCHTTLKERLENKIGKIKILRGQNSPHGKVVTRKDD
jgi:hypothetical protein